MRYTIKVKCYLEFKNSLLQIYATSCNVMKYNVVYIYIAVCFDCFFLRLTPLSAIFQLFHGDQFEWWKKPEFPEKTTDYGPATGELYHLRLRVECTLFCNLQILLLEIKLTREMGVGWDSNMCVTTK